MSFPRTLAYRLQRHAKAGIDAGLGSLAVAMLRMIRATNRKRMANFAGGFMRTLGPRLKEHRIGRDNLIAAFPDKSSAEIEAILCGVWDNLGRVAAEFAHIDRLQMFDPDPMETGDIIYSKEVDARFRRLRCDGKPALVFAAHLANWELPALIAAKYRLDATVLYRRPNIGAVSDAIIKLRKGSMGNLVPTGLDAPFKLLRVLEAGGHVAMLVDQHYVNGVDVTFFGRRCKANPFIARLARHIECPIHGTRIIRLPDQHRFRVDLSEAIEPRRDEAGKIDIAGTMQAITSVVEGWIREHPEQWLWVHRRWR
ncbi:MAG TPA: lipid A biosynthesis lauroyl acyltransferase [Xanthobacteraceae bacterium]|jgi:KDO2-lipid IV(A) lauroyltransferase|nr:lipid A biosynthesis lauroyl acyltransferase [Xanthobacteraceae bacterium]